MLIERRRRTRRARFLVPAGLGIVAVLIIGFVVAGSPLDGPLVAPARAAAAPVNQLPMENATAGRPPVAPLLHDGSEGIRDDASEAFPGDAAPVANLTGYRWPLPHARITLPFGATPWGQWLVDGRSVHDGVDLATFCGDRIVAAHDGTVLAAGRHFDEFLGWVGDLTPYYARLEAKHLWGTLPIVVVIDDGNGYRSMYAHLGKTVVKPGDGVHAGDLLGYEGRTGHASGCHLHYGLFSPFELD
ncbi:MAG: M23 family metallopeptidase, partial [Chloroflexota bacterium]